MLRGNAVTGNPRPPQYLSRHAKVTATTLAQEAQETITAVRKILLVEGKKQWSGEFSLCYVYTMWPHTVQHCHLDGKKHIQTTDESTISSEGLHHDTVGVR